MRRNFLRRPATAGEYAADALRVAGLLSVLVGAIWWSITDAGILALALPALLVPRFVGARAGFDIVYLVTVLVAAWSNVLDLYRSIQGWDLLVHFVCTGVIAAMLYLVLAHLRVVPVRDGRPSDGDLLSRVPIILVTTIGLAVSAVWEMIEWLGHAFVSEEIFVAYDDTIGDMTLGGLGAFILALVVARVLLVRPDAFAGRPAHSPRSVSAASMRE